MLCFCGRAVLVKVKMPGRPVFFVQERMGKDGRIFKCHKFRTMRVRPAVAFSGETAAPSTGSGVCSDAGPGTANDDGWSSVLVAGDSLITPFGAVLRHYKLDELPELWDVMVGNTVTIVSSKTSR